MLKILRPARRGVAFLLGRGNLNAVNANSTLVVPDFTLAGYGAANGSLTAPAVKLSSTGTLQQFNAAEISVPNTSISAIGGGHLDVTLESLILDASGSNTNIGRVNVGLSPFELAATGLTGAIGTANATWFARASLVASGGVVSQLAVPKILVAATGTTGAVGRAALVVPSFTLSAAATQENAGSANLIVPAFRLLWGEARLVVPAFTLTSSGGEVTAASSDIAYSVNLDHGGLTRYPGFSFDHIVKQDGKYYGVRADGIYLLEGITDDGAAIDVLLRTGDMDFGNAFGKRVPYVYTGSAQVINIKTILDSAVVGPVQSQFNNRRTRFGRGTSGQYVALEITNQAGNDFKIDDVELLVETKSRRAF